ncbi:MAG: hypothetical protein AB7I27_04095 [Bacteriovoracaceae bacterium]
MKSLILLLIISLNLPAHSFDGGSGAGNGGDNPRLEFFKIGNNIIDYYKTGFSKIKDILPNPEELRKYLNINVVHTSVDLLYDNKNNPVAAIGEPNSITLYIGDEAQNINWANILKDRRVAETMVLHEMLRASGINDDNFIYSNQVLAEQDIINSAEFKMKWSQDTVNTIKSSLLVGLKSANPQNETTSYEKAFKEIDKINNLTFSKLLGLPLQLSQDIIETNNIEDKKVVFLRKDLKLIRDIVPFVDLFAYEKIKNGKFDQVNANRAIFIIVKDFSLKFSDWGDNSYPAFRDFTDELINNISSDQSFNSNCKSIIESIKDVRSALEGNLAKKEVLKKIYMTTFLLQKNQC